MKSFKDLKTLTEDHHTGPAYSSDFPVNPDGNPDVTDKVASYQVDDNELMSSIDSFITQYTMKEFLDPKQALVNLRAKMNYVGFDFDYTGNAQVEGSYPLNRWGGRTGITPEEGIVEDDGISHVLGHGLELQISLNKTERGLYKIDAAVAPVS
jgi:hypothetical protein